MFNKYKYSLNRGLIKHKSAAKTRRHIFDYAILGKDCPRMYDLNFSKNPENTVILYNSRQYMHKQCDFITQEHNTNLFSQLKEALKFSNDNNLTILIANQSSSSEQLALGFKKQSSLLEIMFNNLKKHKKSRSTIQLSVIGIISQNILTDYFKQLKREDDDQYSKYLMLKFKGEQKSYYLQNLTKKNITNEEELRNQLKEYYYKRSYRESMVFKDSNNSCDWPQAQLFIFTEIQSDPDYSNIRAVAKTHYLLKINQYLKESSPLLLKLGINIRRLQEGRNKNIQTNETRLFKIIGQCFTNSHKFHLQIIYQIGYLSTIRQQYNNLVSLTEDKNSIRTNPHAQNVLSIPFLYLKNYNTFPHIFKMLSNLSIINEPNLIGIENKSKLRSKSYAYETFSSLQKKVIRKYDQLQQQNIREQKDVELFVEQTKKLYKESDIFKNRSGHYKKYSRHQSKIHMKKDLYLQKDEQLAIMKFSTTKNRTRNAPQFSAKVKKHRQWLGQSQNKMKSYQSSGQRKYISYNSMSGNRIEKRINMSQLSGKSHYENTTKHMLQEMVQRQILNFDKEDEFNNEQILDIMI